MTKPKSTTTEQPKADGRKSNELLKARHAAVDTLIAKHREEFDRLYVQEAQARGVTYEPPLTEAQKAKQTLEALLSKHPELAEEIRKQSDAGVSDDFLTGEVAVAEG